MATFIQELAAFCFELSLDAVPDVVTGRMEECLADTLACAIAAAAEPDAPLIEQIIAQAGLERDRPEATVIGAGWKTSARAAALANCTMARYLDANDIYMPPGGSLSGSGHFSDAIPGLIAAAERTGATGAELLAALIAAYEVQAALADSMPWLDRGFHSVSQVTVAVALGAGKLMGLSQEALAHAAGLAATSGAFVQTWLRPGTGVSSLKSAAPGLAAERGILCAELAARGLTAPHDALEALLDYFAGNRVSSLGRERLGREWTVLRNAIKPVPAQIYTQPIVQCAARLYDQGLRLDDIDRLTVRSNDGACGRVQGSPGAFAPESRGAADHSTPFVVAMTLRDGGLTLDSYAGEPWFDPDLRAAMARFELIIDPEWNARLETVGLIGGEIEARDKTGSSYRAEVRQFRGHPDNPLGNEELIAKLEAFASRAEALGSGAGPELLRRCRALRSEPSIMPLIELLTWTGEQWTE